MLLICFATPISLGTPLELTRKWGLGMGGKTPTWQGSGIGIGRLGPTGIGKREALLAPPRMSDIPTTALITCHTSAKMRYGSLK